MSYPGHRKIRGAKRHTKRLAQQSTTAAPLSWVRLKHHHYDYEKLGLAPWHWQHRWPPALVRKLAVQHLLSTFFDWQRQMLAQPEPFYLAIWLVESDFAHSSQVVAGIRERQSYYQNIFGAPDPAGPLLPPEYQLLPGAAQLTWHTHPWEIMLDTDDYPDTWPAWSLSKPHHFYTHTDGRNFMVVQTGWVWVGQAVSTAT